MTHTPWIENDALFKSQLRYGHKIQLKVADKMRELGLEAHVPELRIRKDISEISDFADEPDIMSHGKIIEVKSNKYLFTDDPNSFPFDSILIDTVQGWEDKTRKPNVYVSVSKNGGGMLALFPQLTKEKHWEEREITDNVRGITYMCYACSKEYWRPFNDLIDLLKIEKAKGK